MSGAPLARRLPVVMAGVAGLAVVIAVLVAWPLFIRAAESSTRSTLARTADITAEVLEHTTSAGLLGRPSVGQRLQDLLAAQQVQAFLVLPGSVPSGSFVADDVSAVTSGRTVSARRAGRSGTAFVEGRPVSSSMGVLLVQPSEVARDLARPAFFRLLGALALGLACAAGFGSLLARRITAPLAAAAAAATQIGAGRRDVRVAPVGPQEVAELAVALNGLSEALSLSEGRQRQFFLTVSHELRTPLTSLKGYAEALADDVVPPDQVGAVAAVMRGEADHLDRLVADLLDLARLGAVDLQVSPVDFDLGGLGAEAASVWAGRASRLGIRFVDEVSRDVFAVQTDRVRLRQILDNLMENAMRLTAEGERVVLKIGPHSTSDHFVVEVRDGGPGLSDDDLAVAFQPGELHARYRGIRKVGSGVGLALVDRLAQRLGGRAQAGRAQEGGAAFRVILPVSWPE